MMRKATVLIEKALKGAGLKCQAIDLNEFSFVEAGFSGDNCTFKLRFISPDDDNDVKAMTEDFAKFPQNKLAAGYELINSLNRKYKYAKFTIDSNGAVSAQFDFPVRTSSETLGDEAIEIAIRFSKIIDDVYPDIMRVIYGS